MPMKKHLLTLLASLFFSFPSSFSSASQKKEEAVCRESSFSELEERVNNFFPKRNPLEKKEISEQPVQQRSPYSEMIPPSKFNFQQLFPGVRPYASQGFFPQQHLALGALFEHPFGVTRLTLRGFTDYLQNPHDPQLQVEELAETTLVFFDEGAERKLLQYYVQDAFTPTILGKISATSRLYSQIDGFIVRMRVEDTGYQGQLIWAAPGDFFVGGRYAIDTQIKEGSSIPLVVLLFGNDMLYTGITSLLIPGPLQGSLGVYSSLGSFSFIAEGYLNPEETKIEVKLLGSFYEFGLPK